MNLPPCKFEASTLSSRVTVDTVLIPTKIRPSLAVLNPKCPRQVPPATKDVEKILAQKVESRGDSRHIDILQFYNTIQETKGKQLLDIYFQLYDVLHINVRKDSENIKMIRNNINFKIKNLLEIYPHLRYYGAPKDFNITRLYTVPAILITLNNAQLREQFLSKTCKNNVN